MKIRPVQLLIMISLAMGLAGYLAGCGSGTSGGGVVVTSSAASKDCIACHSSNSRSISSVSGVRITEEWQLSTHNTAQGAGCLDCHSYAHYHDNIVDCRSCHATAHTNNGTACSECHGGSSSSVTNCRSCHADAHTDPESCSRCHSGEIPVDVALKDPDAAGKCYGCHSYSRSFRNISIARRHFNNFTGAGVHPAKYVTSNYQRSCTSCHEPHNPLKGLGKEQRPAWARSGHGDVNGIAWTDRDFKENVSCIRCHTATGYINYVQSNYALPQVTWAAAGDTGREVLTCRACHLSSNFKNSVRPAGAYTAPFGVVNNVVTTPLVFVDVSRSNLCVPCHSGRESGASMVAAITDFTNASFKNPHYLADAAVFYGKGGYQFYTSNARYNRYAAERVGASAGWSHGRLGINNYKTTTNAAVIADKGSLVYSGTSGQCVACHLGAGTVAGNHAFDAYQVAKATWTATYKGCYGCHTDEDMEEVGAEERALFDRGMAFFKFTLAQNNIFYTDVYPYFMTAASGGSAIKNWTLSATLPVGPVGGSGAQNMGSAMNYKLLSAARGSHVHNRAFSRALISDSIVYLQRGNVGNRSLTSTDPNNIMNFTNYSTALAASPDTVSNPSTGIMISISQLKGWILRKSGSNYSRR